MLLGGVWRGGALRRALVLRPLCTTVAPAGPVGPSAPHRAGDEVELAVHELAFGGFGVGRTGDGFVVMVEGAIPGSRIRASLEKIHKSFAKGRTQEVLEPSPHGVAPPCPHFATCGGCALQHLAYSQQLVEKRVQVVGLLSKALGHTRAHLDSLVRAVPPAPSRGVRPQMKFMVQFVDGVNPHLLTASRDVRSHHLKGYAIVGLPLSSGWRAESGGDFEDRVARIERIDECWVQHDLANTILRELTTAMNQARAHTDRSFLKHITHVTVRVGKAAGDEASHVAVLCFETGLEAGLHRRRCRSILPMLKSLLNAFPQICQVSSFPKREDAGAMGACTVVFGKPTVREQFGDVVLNTTGELVHQASPYLSPELWEAVKNVGEFRPDDVVVHLFSGEGGLTLSLARQTREVYGLERSTRAVGDATANAQLNDIPNAHFVECNLEKEGPRNVQGRRQGQRQRRTGVLPIPSSIPTPTYVVVTSPLHGTANSVLKWACSQRPRRIMYVGHDAALAARDLKRVAGFAKQGEGWQYRIVGVQPLDARPHAPHITVVAVMEREECN